MRLSNAVAGAISIASLLGLFVGFQLWGEHQRRREWWWIGGDPKGMLFLDLATASEAKGHVLSTDGETGDEFAVEWNCQRKTVRWGAMWTRDSDFNQVDRHPATKNLAEWHAARDDSEHRVLEVACAKPADRFSLRSVKTDRQPIEATHYTLELVQKGTQPHEALFRALAIRGAIS
jgi:hypothetical protein